MKQEEKAKAYDEALKRAKNIHDKILNNELLGFPDQIREIFPELRESEDERMNLGENFNNDDMKKIPFSIKYRDKIESGEYTVITFSGYPVTIYRWDYKDKDGTPILGSYVQDGYEYAAGWYKDGKFNEKPSDLDLILVTNDEKHLTPLAELLSTYLKNDFEWFARNKWDEKKWNEVMNTQAAELQRIAWLEKQKEQNVPNSIGIYYYDGKDLLYGGNPATEDNPYDFAMSQQEKQKPVEWKPTEEQMNALNFAITYMFSTKANPTVLRDLYNDLLKLK